MCECECVCVHVWMWVWVWVLEGQREWGTVHEFVIHHEPTHTVHMHMHALEE